jgi:hypothetical protein
MDGRTDRHNELTVTFRKFADAPKTAKNESILNVKIIFSCHTTLRRSAFVSRQLDIT